MDIDKPLTPDQAKRLARQILATGVIAFVPHAIARGEERSITEADARNTINGGICRRVEWNAQFEQWRYLFETARFEVVFAFLAETNLLVITLIRRK